MVKVWIGERLLRIKNYALLIILALLTLITSSLALLSITGELSQLIYQPLEVESDWVTIPAGEFIMGAESSFDYEAPIHNIYLDSYQVNVYEVTNKYYSQCVKAGICKDGGWKYQDANGKTISYLDDLAYANYPVNNVNWFQAKTYCEWISARLPTEAEWEKAARGTDGRTYPWGEIIAGGQITDCAYGNFQIGEGVACVGSLSPVGNYPSGRSPYGVYDMAGNVAEWVSDWFQSDYYTLLGNNAFNPQGPSNGNYRGVRGGSWLGGVYIARSASRGYVEPTYSAKTFGFRCARSSP